MKNLLGKAMLKAYGKFNSVMNEESGEVNLVAILLIIVVTLGLVVIFKTQITAIINNIFTKINKTVSGI